MQTPLGRSASGWTSMKVATRNADVIESTTVFSILKSGPSLRLSVRWPYVTIYNRSMSCRPCMEVEVRARCVTIACEIETNDCIVLRYNVTDAEAVCFRRRQCSSCRLCDNGSRQLLPSSARSLPSPDLYWSMATPREQRQNEICGVIRRSRFPSGY